MRNANPANPRSPLVRLTLQGLAIVGKLQACQDALDGWIADRFPATDVAAARRTLEGLVHAYAAIGVVEVKWAYDQVDDGFEIRAG